MTVTILDGVAHVDDGRVYDLTAGVKTVAGETVPEVEWSEEEQAAAEQWRTVANRAALKATVADGIESLRAARDEAQAIADTEFTAAPIYSPAQLQAFVNASRTLSAAAVAALDASIRFARLLGDRLEGLD